MYFTVLVSLGLLTSSTSRLPAAEANKCSEKEMLLRQIPRVATQLTDCLMECSGMTFIKKLQLQDNRNIQFKDSTEGKEPCIQLSIFYSVNSSLPPWHPHALYCVLIAFNSLDCSVLAFSQETSGNTAGLQSSSAPLERAFTVPMWSCQWIYLQLDMRCWKSRPQSPLPPDCTCTTAPPRSQRAVASSTMSRSTSAQRVQGLHSACRWSLRKMSLVTDIFGVPPIWSHSGRECSPAREAVDKISVLRQVHSFAS